MPTRILRWLSGGMHSPPQYVHLNVMITFK
jgi:hypothetical protein